MILVGFDGSEPAEAALRWAAAEAVLRGTELHVLRAWHLSEELTAVLADRGMAEGVPPESELQALVQQRLEADVASLLPADQRSGVRCRAVRNHPATMLIEASAEADLLVVGPRGHGRVASLVLGSVSLACVHQAACSVVIARS